MYWERMVGWMSVMNVSLLRRGLENFSLFASVDTSVCRSKNGVEM